MATNPYYTVTGAPATQSRGVSATIRSEYSLINTGFDAVYVAMLLRGLKGGETWTGTHVFTGATVTFTTQSALDNSTKAATTAYADGAVSASAVTLNAAIALKGTIAGQTWTGTHGFTGASVTFATQSASDNSTKAATTAYADGAVATSASTLNASIALKADVASPTFTGTPAAPTAAAGTSTTQIATCSFVMSTAFSAALPAQVGNGGKFVTTDGSSASWAALPVIPAGASIYTALNFGGF